MNGKETCELVECVESAGIVSIPNFVATFFCYGIKIIYIFFFRYIPRTHCPSRLSSKL